MKEPSPIYDGSLSLMNARLTARDTIKRKAYRSRLDITKLNQKLLINKPPVLHILKRSSKIMWNVVG